MGQILESISDILTSVQWPSSVIIIAKHGKAGVETSDIDSNICPVVITLREMSYVVHGRQWFR